MKVTRFLDESFLSKLEDVVVGLVFILGPIIFLILLVKRLIGTFF